MIPGKTILSIPRKGAYNTKVARRTNARDVYFYLLIRTPCAKYYNYREERDILDILTDENK